MSEVKAKQLPNGETLYTAESTTTDGRPDVTGFAEVLERMLANHPDDKYIELTGHLRRELCEQLVFILGRPKGQVS